MKIENNKNTHYSIAHKNRKTSLRLWLVRCLNSLLDNIQWADKSTFCILELMNSENSFVQILHYKLSLKKEFLSYFLLLDVGFSEKWFY